MKFPRATAVIALAILAGCATPNPRVTTRLNDPAAILGNLPSDPLLWKVITSSVDSRHSTMSTLFGNDPAVQYARTHSDSDYPAGSVLALVSWTGQEDQRWFGGRIPASVKSVEFADVNAGADGHASYTYQRFEGAPLSRVAIPDRLPALLELRRCRESQFKKGRQAIRFCLFCRCGPR